MSHINRGEDSKASWLKKKNFIIGQLYKCLNPPPARIFIFFSLRCVFWKAAETHSRGGTSNTELTVAQWKLSNWQSMSYCDSLLNIYVHMCNICLFSASRALIYLFWFVWYKIIFQTFFFNPKETIKILKCSISPKMQICYGSLLSSVLSPNYKPYGFPHGESPVLSPHLHCVWVCV